MNFKGDYLNDDIIQKVCTPILSTNTKYDLSKILTSESYRYLGGCLFVSTDPIKTTYNSSKELLEDCESASKIIKRYND